MAHENILKVERLVELGNGLAIWKVHIDALREQDKNARVMAKDKFERLTENIKKDKRLESLPLVTPKTNEAENKEFLIISGHHRVRAARAAGMQEVFVIVDENQLTHDQIRAKQLAHNALAGHDDVSVLAELYAEIEDINEKLASGVTEIDLNMEMPSIGTDDVEVNFDFELLNILFLPKQAKKFDEVLDMVEPHAKLYLADKAEFEELKGVIQEISKRENVRNISAIVSKMIDICQLYCAEHIIKIDENAKETKTTGTAKDGAGKKPKAKGV